MKNNSIYKIVSLLLVMALCFTFLVGCGGSSGSDDGSATDDTQTFEWDMIVTCNAQHMVYQQLQNYADEVREKTDGRLDITVRPTGELPYSQDEYLGACRDGAVQMAMLISTGVSTQLQSGSIAALPMLITSHEQQAALMDAIGDELENELEAYGCSSFMNIYYSGQNFWGVGDTPKSYKDLAKRKIRVQGVEQSDFMQMFGGVPVTIDWAEVPTSMSRGVCDVAVTATATAVGSAMYEYCNWGFIVPVMNVVTYMVYNDKAFAELPEDIQKVVLEVGEDYSNNVFPAADDEFSANAIAELEKNGMEISYISDEEKNELVAMMKDYWIAWAEAKGGSVPENLQKVLSALGIA